MSRRAPRAVAPWLASVLLVGAAGCATAQPQTVRGVVIDVDGASLQRFDSFTVRTADGQVLVFKPAAGFFDAAAHGEQMSPGHVREHMALAVPVQVTYRRAEDGSLVALAATDG